MLVIFIVNHYKLSRKHSRGHLVITMITYLVIIACYFAHANCATLQKVPVSNYETEDLKLRGNVTSFSSRQSIFPVHFVNPSLITNSPPSLLPFYQRQIVGFTHPAMQNSIPFYNDGSPKKPVKKKETVKVKEVVDLETLEEQKASSFDEENDKGKVKVQKLEDKKKDSVPSPETVESKTTSDDGTGRGGCPACVAGDCDPNLDPHTNISGIPVIQIIIAGIIGAFWAGIFLFILHNFVEREHKHGFEDEDEGYGGHEGYETHQEHGAPHHSYGTPQHHYGEPHHAYGPQRKDNGYNIQRVSKRVGRSSGGFSINDFANSVYKAIDKLIERYDKPISE